MKLFKSFKLMRKYVFKFIYQVVKGVIQDREFRIISYDERQLAVAREKLRVNPYACLHIDITGNVVNKWNEREVFNTACVFRG